MRTLCGTILAALLPVAVCAETYTENYRNSG